MRTILALSFLLAMLCCCQRREAKTAPRGEIASMIDEMDSNEYDSDIHSNSDSSSQNTGLTSIDTISDIIVRTYFREYKDKFVLHKYNSAQFPNGVYVDSTSFPQGYGVIEFINPKAGRRDTLTINIELIEQLYKNDSIDYQIYRYQFLNLELDSLNRDAIRFRIYCCQPDSDVDIDLFMNLNNGYVDFFSVYYPLDSEYPEDYGTIDTTQISQPHPVADVFGVSAKRFEWMSNWPDKRAKH